MNVAGQPDRLEVVNGPEDGTQFPVTRTPIDLGSDTRCAVHLRFDHHIDSNHARISVVDGGYRVRRTGQGTLLINGKRVGRVRSRILRHGGILTAGATEICLQLAGHGLASRSYGMNLESDTSWFLRTGVQETAAWVGWFVGGVFRFARRRPVVSALLLLVVGGYFYLGPSNATAMVSAWLDWLSRWALYYANQVGRMLRELLSR